jgi:signal transduction histidine kinase
VNLGDLLSEARDHTNPPDWIDVRIVGAESVPQVYVPRLSVREVFANIIKNAVEAIAATGADEGKITVECTPAPDTGEVLVSISDTGCGFTEQQRAQLFQPLWKQKPRRGRGMGFALWWAHKLLTVIGGRISAESPGVNQGATFRVWLPAEGREVEQGERR